MKKVLVIGAGGIGSFVCKELFNLFMSNQVNLEDCDVYVADFDSVEKKNITYQDFEVADIFKNKALVIGARYNFHPISKKVEEADLEPFDIFIVAADNGRIRKIVYDHAIQKSKPFIDLRSEGRTIAVFTSSAKSDELFNSLNQNTLDESGSCQLKYEFEQNIIQIGNKIVAMIGAQLFLNLTRGEYLLPTFVQRF
jgi:molybdopterin/thiamine biosynthesis adenylyltransferase